MTESTKFIRVLGSIALATTIVCSAAVGHTAAKPATFDLTTYTVPDGFEILAGGPTFANFRRVEARNWILVAVYGSKVATGSLATDFVADWKDISGAPNVPPPSPASRKVGAGSVALEGGVICPSIGYVDLIDIDAGGKVVSVIIETGNEEGFTKTYRTTIDAFLAGLVVKTARGAPVANAAPAVNAAPVVAATSLTAQTVVGHWYASDHATTSYVNSDTGAYAGSSATFYGIGYDMAADGTYKSHFSGMANNHIVKEDVAGTWQLTADRFIVTHEKNVTKYQLLGFQKLADGTLQIDLLNEYYPPARGNIALYAEHWTRPPAGAKPAK